MARPPKNTWARGASLAFMLLAQTAAQAQSSFSGVLIATNGSGIVAGNIQLTVDGGQVTFQATLFRAWASGELAPMLDAQGEKIAFNLATSTNGNWPAGEFIGPLPGQSIAPISNPQFPNLEQMPGPQTLSAGTRFAGSFAAFPELENALLISGGKVSLRVNGTVEGMTNPTVTEILVVTRSRIANQFAVTLSGTNEVPPLATLHHGSGAFTLAGNSLIYCLAFDSGFPVTRVAMFAPVAPHSQESLPVADLRHSIAGDSGTVTFRGQVKLTGAQVESLRRGELYVNAFSALHSRGELRGFILPVLASAAPAVRNQPVISVAPK